MTLTAFLICFAEFILETFGALRSRILPLRLLFTFTALTDFAALVALAFHAYTWELYWLQRAGKYVFLAVLAVAICRQMLNASDNASAWAAGIAIAAGAGLLCGLSFSQAQSLLWKLIDAAVGADMFLGIVIVLAWVGKETRLERPWPMIAAALIGLLFWDGAMVLGIKFSPLGRHFFWIGEVSALIMWNQAAARDFQVFAFRRELGQRAEALPKEQAKGAIQ